MTNCEECAPNKCSCKNDGQCSHPKEALEYCACCNCIKCNNCDEKWHSLADQYTFTYYPPWFPAPYVPVTSCDPDPPFYYTTCGCNIGDS